MDSLTKIKAEELPYSRKACAAVSAGPDSLSPVSRLVESIEELPSNGARKWRTQHSKRKHASKKPYELDKVLCMDKLSFESETCTNRSCTCCRPKNRRRYVFSLKGDEERQVILRPPRLVLKSGSSQPVLKASRLLLRNAAGTASSASSPGPRVALTPGVSHSAPASNQSFSSDLQSRLSAASLGAATSGTRSALPRQYDHYVSAASLSLTSSKDSADDHLAGQNHLSARVAAAGSKTLLGQCPRESDHADTVEPSSCSHQAHRVENYCDYTINELASYFEEFVHIPKKMSAMAEMMYG